jgi:hypothetical protein
MASYNKNSITVRFTLRNRTAAFMIFEITQLEKMEFANEIFAVQLRTNC